MKSNRIMIAVLTVLVLHGLDETVEASRHHHPHHQPQHTGTYLSRNSRTSSASIFHSATFVFRNATQQQEQEPDPNARKTFETSPLSPPPPPPKIPPAPVITKVNAAEENGNNNGEYQVVCDDDTNTKDDDDNNNNKVGDQRDSHGTTLFHHPAVHVVEHNAKHKVGYDLAQHVTEKVVHSLEQISGRVGTSATERTVQQVAQARKTSSNVKKVATTGLGERLWERLFSKSKGGAAGTRSTVKAVSSRSERALEGMGERALDQIVRATTEHASEKTLERAGEKLVSHMAGQQMKGSAKVATKVVGEATIKKGMARTTERMGEQTLERMGERLLLEQTAKHGGSKVVTRTAERFSERAIVEGVGRGTTQAAGSRALEQVGRKSLTAAGVKATERVGEKTLERTGERLVSHMGQKGTKAIEHMGEAAILKGVTKTTERVGERALVGTTTQVAMKAVEHMGETSIYKGVTRTSERIGERALEGVGRGTQRVALRRMGRGLMISLPFIGGLFALYLFKSDIHRVQEDWSEQGKCSLLSFMVATFADFVDSVLHFYMAFALLLGIAHHNLVVAEELSLGCAAISTICAVLGEIISHRRRRRTQQQQHDIMATASI